MTMNHHHTLWIGLMGLILLNTGCDRLSQGVVQEIEFPEHEPRLAVTMLCNWDADTLVARAQSSAGILDSVGSQKQKEALFTLSHTGGASHTWGGTDDWENGIGHVLVNPGLEEGDWTLTVEAPGFDPATALQSTPPRIDTLLGSTYRMTYALSWSNSRLTRMEAYSSASSSVTFAEVTGRSKKKSCASSRWGRFNSISTICSTRTLSSPGYVSISGSCQDKA